MNLLGKNMNQHRIKLIQILTILRLRGEKKKHHFPLFYLLTDAPMIWKHQNITAGPKALKMEQNYKTHSGATAVQVCMSVGGETLCSICGGQSKSPRQEGSVCLPGSQIVLWEASHTKEGCRFLSSLKRVALGAPSSCLGEEGSRDSCCVCPAITAPSMPAGKPKEEHLLLKNPHVTNSHRFINLCGS